MIDARSRQLRRVTMLLDLCLTTVAFLCAFPLRGFLLNDYSGDFRSHVALLPFILSLWMFSLTLWSAYGSPRTTSPLAYMRAILRAVTTGLVALITLLFVLKIQYVSRAAVIIFTALDFLALVGLRFAILWYFQQSLRKGERFRRVLIVGSGTRARRLAETLIRHSDWGISIVGHLDPDPMRVGERVLGSSVLGTVGDISSVLKDNVIDEVILAIPRAMIPDVDKIAQACEEEGVNLCLMADVFNVRVARMRLVELGAIPLLTLEPVAQEEWKLLVKRFIDLAATIVLIPLLSPVMAVIALAIKLDSRGPVFFVQERVGLHKRRFFMFKFRTMITGADRLQAGLEALNEAEGPIFKIADDPRITRVGRILRRTSLDELPQIFHVFTGVMSLVGPRPMSLRDVELFDRGIQRKRFMVKPGLTCLWQVSGRSLLPFSKWLELDLHYIDHWSLILDLKILVRTIPVVIRGTGAK